MGTPSQASRVAWYQLGSSPGDVGDAVLAGHLDWTNGPAVFWYLGKLLVVLFVFVWLRGTLPRLRYDQLMALGWKFLIPVSLVWLLGSSFVIAANDTGWF